MMMPPGLFGGRRRGRGRDPFDDPFFTNPFGGMLHPNPFAHDPFMGGVPPFGSSLFGPNGSPNFMDAHTLYDQTQSMIPNRSRGPVIEEVNASDDDDDEKEEEQETQLSVMHDTQYSRPQAHSFSFQSSTVTYGGGSNGAAYYTSSTTRRSGSDGLRFEEHKEADSVSGEAAHRISRGIHNKGHTVQRHLKSDGHVDTMQTLHNINQDEVSGFEEAWKGRGGWVLPSTYDNTRGGGRRRLGGARQHAHSSNSNRR